MSTSALLPAQTPAAWKSAVVYQIYPASFCDSNGDGVGDLAGIISKLDYIQRLGADVVWLCPHLASPGVDNGYDCSDYEAIDPKFGDMETNQRLIDELHKRGMKMMMDLVVNHTSDKHAWFQDSRSSRSGARADWYIWRDAKHTADGQRVEPNNWASIWGGSAWSWDETRQQYYLHLFSPQQPDLNWDCASLRQEIYAMVRRWHARGVDGWRLDAINFISKPQSSDAALDLPDAPVTQPEERYQPAFELFSHGPRIHQYLKELYREALGPDVMTVGEAAGTSPEQSVAYTEWETREDKELQMVFSTEHVDLYGGFSLAPVTPLRHGEMRSVLARWQTSLLPHGSWQSSFMSNHDLPRAVPNFLRAETPEHRWRAAKLLALHQASQCGTPFVYQGEELGMINVPYDWGIEEYPDLVSQKFYHETLKARQAAGDAEPDMSDVMAAIRRKARDNSRTPMPWDGSASAGFSSGKPWMRVNPDNVACNVDAQEQDDDSVLAFWRRALALRKAHDVLVYGAFELLLEPTLGAEEVVVYSRTLGEKRAVYVANLGFEELKVDLTRAGLSSEMQPALAVGSERSMHMLQGLEARLYLL